MLKELLESKLGPLEDAEFYFALEQLAANQAMTDIGTLDELSTNIDFYRREVEPYVQKKEKARESKGVCGASCNRNYGICTENFCNR
jgi:hypothetical protein